MKYNEIISLKEGYNDVFDMADEQKGYWENFVTNKQFEDNLLRIIRCFTSPIKSDHKSIWVQGTYGTGKSHSTSVIKHLLSDPLDEINGFINNLMNQQLRNELNDFRRNKRIFPIVIKGNHNISEASDMNSVIQTEVKRAFKKSGITLNVSSDFETILKILKEPNFSSIRDELICNDLCDYVSNIEELFEKLENEDGGILKIIHKKLKQYNLFAATNNITIWLRQVRDYLRTNNIADNLVIFWDEFTSLLSISEKKAIYSIVQDIAELSKTDDGGIYIFLITHVSFETTDAAKDMGSDERDHIKDRFVFLTYQIQYDTTYTILFSALNRTNPDYLKKLVDERMKRNLEVIDCLDLVVKDAVNQDDSKMKLYGLYPFHPYTAYISTFLARIIGSSERSVFNFLNDKDNGFLAFLNNDINDKKFINIDNLWDFFLEKFKENPKYFEVLDVYKKNMDLVKMKGSTHFSVFKAILLLNIMQSTAGTEEDSDERSLTSPSIKNIERAFSGTFSKTIICDCLDGLDNSGIIQKTPDNRYEFAVSGMPREKIDAKLSGLRDKYSSVSDIFNAFPGTADSVKKIIMDSTDLKRPSIVEFFGANFKEPAITAKLDLWVDLHPGCVIVCLFMHLGFPISESNAELTQDELRTKLLSLSNRDKYRNIVFLQLNNICFEQRRYNGFIEQLARMEIANESGSTNEGTNCRNSAIKWMNQFINQISIEGNVHLLFSGTILSCSYLEVPGKITNKILPAIFKNGLDSLKRIKNTVWKIKKAPLEKSIGKMFENNRDEIAKDSKLCDLLKNENGQYVFTENMDIDDFFEETPVTKLCNEVKRILNEHQNDSIMNLTDYFDWIFEPPYGYIMTESSMAALGLAFRPFINKMFVSSTSSSINDLKMVSLVSDLMDYYLGKRKDSPNLHVRFCSLEERELMNILINTFALNKNDNDGLLNIKWNLRDKFEKDNKAPLWVLKYVPKQNSKLESLFNDLFEFTQRQNDDINEKVVNDLLKEIKDKRIETITAINDVKKDDCLAMYVKIQLEDKNHAELDLEEAISYLKSDLSGEIVFWNEIDVKASLDKFISTVTKGSSCIINEKSEEVDSFKNPQEEVEKKKRELFSVINDPSISKEDLVKAITKFTTSKPIFAKELLAILNKGE